MFLKVYVKVAHLEVECQNRRKVAREEKNAKYSEYIASLAEWILGQQFLKHFMRLVLEEFLEESM